MNELKILHTSPLNPLKGRFNPKLLSLNFETITPLRGLGGDN